MSDILINRRDAIRAGLGAALACSPCLHAMAASEQRTFKIGACDWSIRKRGQPSALELAKEIGLDGVEVTFGKPGDEYDLRKEDVRQLYKKMAQDNGVEIASLAMGILNQVPYASAPETERWVEECVDVMSAMGVKVVLLAFFSDGDIKGKPEAQREVVRRLKKVAPKAERAGVILGIESMLNAKEHLRIVNAVDSPSVQVYYDVANMHGQGYNIYREIRQLGGERICQIHCKENGCLLGQGPIDFAKVKEAIDDSGYQGWLIIEGAVDPDDPDRDRKVQNSYVKNQKFLRSVFPT